ncbi:MAG: hydroxyacylglutathione hydrolase [Pseudomonadota bacterium]|nr:hydroxyacylglutathione hydrolase [Pseudomonadota bacterium]
MSKLEIHQIPTRSDNYVYLLRESSSGNAAVVDPSDATPVLDTLEMFGWSLTHVLATHHHDDHVGGVPEIKAATGCTVVGPKADRDRIPMIDVEVADGDTYTLFEASAKVWDVPGHTAGHIAYWFSDSSALFCGDTLFALGCGRVFEGTFEQMYHSISKFKEVPDETWVYCAHEYTMANAKFALHVDPDNTDLQAYARQIESRRNAGVSTVPSLMGLERKTNPFLRADQPEFAAVLGMESSSPVDVFAEVRSRKDNF